MNGYQRVQNADPALDDFAAKVADAVIARERPDAGSVTIRAADAGVYHTVGQDLLNSPEEAVIDQLLLGLQVDKGNGHGWLALR